MNLIQILFQMKMYFNDHTISTPSDESCIPYLDFYKAFDLDEQKCIFISLGKFGFGPLLSGYFPFIL